jgi:hypothetical protein
MRETAWFTKEIRGRGARTAVPSWSGVLLRALFPSSDRRAKKIFQPGFFQVRRFAERDVTMLLTGTFQESVRIPESGSVNDSQFHSLLAWNNRAHQTAVAGTETVADHATRPVEFFSGVRDGRADDLSQSPSDIADRDGIRLGRQERHRRFDSFRIGKTGRRRSRGV